MITIDAYLEIDVVHLDNNTQLPIDRVIGSLFSFFKKLHNLVPSYSEKNKKKCMTWNNL